MLKDKAIETVAPVVLDMALLKARRTSITQERDDFVTWANGQVAMWNGRVAEVDSLIQLVTPAPLVPEVVAAVPEVAPEPEVLAAPHDE
jgi:hypothetical protein